MEKMDGMSMDLKAENIAQLKALFPEAVTEGKVDFEVLKALLGGEIEQRQEYYKFTWNGKEAARAYARTRSMGTLRPCVEESSGKDGTPGKFDSDNLYIEGDNLEVLKLLQGPYHKKVKMIYIDPPYNTGHDFVYPDNFKDSIGNYKALTGQTDDEGKSTRANPETSGRYHTDWLNMMYPRLILARNLLTDDGVIFISIDDSEQDNLKRLCNDIFGEESFIATIVRNTNSSKNQSLFVSVSHEYCLVYAKNIDILQQKHAENKWAVPKNNVNEYVAKVKQLKQEGLSPEAITDELKTLTKYPRFIDFTNYWYFDSRGLYMKDNLGGVSNGNPEPIFNPITQKYDSIPPGGFRYNTATLEELIADNRIHFHKDGSLPRLKRYLKDNLSQRPKSIMSDDQRPDYSLMAEFNTPFDNPKQLAFMQRILSVGDTDSIILDFFSGSATTAHAVQQLNAEDGGNRKYIMVQLPEVCEAGTEAAKAGYANICEIGKERIRRAAKKIKGEHPEWNGDMGFKVFKLDTSNLLPWNPNADELEQNLFAAVDNVLEGRTTDDLLHEILLKCNLPLTLPIETKQCGSNTIYLVGAGALAICLDKNIPATIAEEIVRLRDEYAPIVPMQVVFRDNGFNDVTKTNALQILKQAGFEEKSIQTI